MKNNKEPRYIHKEPFDTFPFERMAAVMKAMKWKWTYLNSVPTVEDIKQEARRAYRDMKDSPFTSSGGMITFNDGQFAFDGCKHFKQAKELWQAYDTPIQANDEKLHGVQGEAHSTSSEPGSGKD